MDVKYTQCDICKRKAEKPYKLKIEPKIINCNYDTNEIDICEDCLSCISNLTLYIDDKPIVLSNLLRGKGK